MPAPVKNQRYTYADYCSWDDECRWELIGGVPYLMSSPRRIHQEIIGELYMQFASHLKGKPETVLFAPFDVRLNPHGADDTVVQPDVIVICDLSKLDDKCCVGAPDLAIEILSPSTESHDRMVKLEVYRQAGIMEYWIVDPDAKTVETFLLEDGQYNSRMYSDKEIVPVAVLDGCGIDLREVFAE